MLTPAAPYRPWLQAAALALALFGSAVAAESPPPMPVERFFQQPAVLQAKLSPSGRQVALTTARGAKRVGLVVITLSYPDEAHGWREVPTQIDFARRVEAFLARHLGARPHVERQQDTTVAHVYQRFQLSRPGSIPLASASIQTPAGGG